MTGFTPAEVFPPGEYIQDELDARGWSLADLARLLGQPLDAVHDLIEGPMTIVPELARALAEAFGTSSELWTNLEHARQLNQRSRGTATSPARDS
jgi:HTH-type transcriptional regulator / antitoxin HigA